MSESDSTAGTTSEDPTSAEGHDSTGTKTGATTSTKAAEAKEDGHVHDSSHSIQVFSAPSDAPRVRWRTDLISAGFTASLLIFLIIVAGEGSSLDRNTLAVVGDLPGWLVWIGQTAYVVGVLYALGLLIGVGIFARGRLELLRDMVLAAVLAVVIVLVLTQWINNRWPELAVFDLQETRETFPAFFVTTAAAIQAAASPHLTSPMRKIGWTFVLAAVIASVFGGVYTLSGAIGGLLIGLISAALIRYAFGTTAGLPSTNRIRAGLADLDVHVDDLHYAAEQPTTSIRLTATADDGTPLLVKGLGRDSWQTRRSTRLWHEAWYHSEGAQYGSDRRQQVEHEAFVLLLANRAGVSVPALVTAGMTEHDDALLVTERDDRTLRDLAVDDVTDKLLDAIWEQLGELRAAGLSNGRLDQTDIWINGDGKPAIAGFANAAIHPSDAQLNEDVASLLVNTTLIVGPDRAIAASRRGVGDDVLAATLPVLQTASLSPTLRHQAKHQKLKIKDLRKDVASAIDTKVPELQQLQRVTLGGVISTGLAGFAFYSIVSALAGVGFDTIVDTLADARWGLVIIALGITQLTNVTDAVSAVAASPKRVPLGVTTIEQFSISYVDLVTPSTAGMIAMNARYFQKFGIGAVTATTVGVMTGIVELLAELILVVLTVLVGAGSIDLSQLEADGSVLRLIGFALVLFLVACVVVYFVPKWRKWMSAKIKGPVAEIGHAIALLRNPKRFVLTFGGAITTEILFAGGLALCVLASGGSISFGEAIFINVVVSAFAGLMPVPGGVGVYEAGLVAGLTAVGVSNDIAVSATLIFRLLSFYLPPIWGYVALRWLKQRDYL